MFNIYNEFDKLIKNGWLSKEEAENFANDENILNCIKTCTSPSKINIFNALNLVCFNDVKVVILGQDPYPNPNHAHGLAFSSRDTKTPESLKNIYRVIDLVYGTKLQNSGKNELTNWAKQGVLLLNTGLTFQKIDDIKCDKNNYNKIQQSIQKKHLKAWKPFINAIIRKVLSVNSRPVVMYLWGNAAHELVFKNINNKEFQTYLHTRTPVTVPGTTVILMQTSHPSPLSVNRGGDFIETFKVQLQAGDNYLGKDNIIEWNKDIL